MLGNVGAGIGACGCWDEARSAGVWAIGMGWGASHDDLGSGLWWLVMVPERAARVGARTSHAERVAVSARVARARTRIP
jgi:hypothetical protein